MLNTFLRFSNYTQTVHCRCCLFILTFIIIFTFLIIPFYAYYLNDNSGKKKISFEFWNLYHWLKSWLNKFRIKCFFRSIHSTLQLVEITFAVFTHIFTLSLRSSFALFTLIMMYNHGVVDLRMVRNSQFDVQTRTVSAPLVGFSL